jgi:hypothetical protein
MRCNIKLQAQTRLIRRRLQLSFQAPSSHVQSESTTDMTDRSVNYIATSHPPIRVRVPLQVSKAVASSS